MANVVDKKNNNNNNKAVDIDSDELDLSVGAITGRPSAKSKAGAAKSKTASSKSKTASGGTKANSDKKKADSNKKEEAKSVDDDVSIESDASSSEDEGNDIAQERYKYLRLAAEYDNYRKRSAKERETTYTAARVDTIAKLLPVYDNLERALKMECADEAYYKGVKMTMTQLLEIFESMDVKPIPAVNEPFDPNHHNAVMTIENPELGSKIVAEEFQKGFILGDKVIRHSTVVVAN